LNQNNIKLSNDTIDEFIIAKPYIIKLDSKQQKTRNQHYVPQLYLKKFVNGDNKLEVFDNKNLRQLNPKSTKSVCSSDFFYSVRD
jgi:hypothetical protein